MLVYIIKKTTESILGGFLQNVKKQDGWVKIRTFPIFSFYLMTGIITVNMNHAEQRGVLLGYGLADVVANLGIGCLNRKGNDNIKDEIGMRRALHHAKIVKG